MLVLARAASTAASSTSRALIWRATALAACGCARTSNGSAPSTAGWPRSARVVRATKRSSPGAPSAPPSPRSASGALANVASAASSSAERAARLCPAASSAPPFAAASSASRSRASFASTSASKLAFALALSAAPTLSGWHVSALARKALRMRVAESAAALGVRVGREAERGAALQRLPARALALDPREALAARVAVHAVGRVLEQHAAVVGVEQREVRHALGRLGGPCSRSAVARSPYATASQSPCSATKYSTKLAASSSRLTKMTSNAPGLSAASLACSARSRCVKMWHAGHQLAEKYSPTAQPGAKRAGGGALGRRRGRRGRGVVRRERRRLGHLRRHGLEVLLGVDVVVEPSEVRGRRRAPLSAAATIVGAVAAAAAADDRAEPLLAPERRLAQRGAHLRRDERLALAEQPREAALARARRARAQGARARGEVGAHRAQPRSLAP